jgi:hypothetical protein
MKEIGWRRPVTVGDRDCSTNRPNLGRAEANVDRVSGSQAARGSWFKPRMTNSTHAQSGTRSR